MTMATSVYESNNLSQPTKAQILVIGGGPAGSYAATSLAREGFQVVLLEATKFPRYHIGESLLPSVRPFLRFIDAEDIVDSHGFIVKPGGAIKLNQYKQEGYTDFLVAGGNTAWQVIRAEFDDLLLKHAANSGATVIEETKVMELQFVGRRPVSATWVASSGVKGQITFDYLVDASGRNGIISTKYLHDRRFNKSLNNTACWGYWEGAGSYRPGTSRENAIWAEALPDESGWAWFIPLHDGTTSVGVIMDKETSVRKRKEVGNGSEMPSIETHYLQEVHKVPGIMKLLEKATLRNSGQRGAVRSASDYSYSASSYAGDHYRIAGDAGAFIDPFFSSGVHLAFTGGLSAALTIAASIRGLTTETEAQQWHTSKVTVAYTRFLLVVLGAYKQIRNQALPVMSDVNEDNFDRAFESIRPVIQGTADIGKTLSEDELQKTMHLCYHLLPIGDLELELRRTSNDKVAPKLASSGILNKTKANLDTHPMDDAVDEEAKHALQDIDHHKLVGMVFDVTHKFNTDNHFGFKAVLQRGKLGLTTSTGEGERASW